MPSAKESPTAASLIPEIGPDPVAAVRAGLPYAALEHVREHLEASDDLLARALGISSRTLSRRRETGTLTTDESDRLVLLARDCFDFTRWHSRQCVTTQFAGSRLCEFLQNEEKHPVPRNEKTNSERSKSQNSL